MSFGTTVRPAWLVDYERNNTVRYTWKGEGKGSDETHTALPWYEFGREMAGFLTLRLSMVSFE